MASLEALTPDTQPVIKKHKSETRYAGKPLNVYNNEDEGRGQKVKSSEHREWEQGSDVSHSSDFATSLLCHRSRKSDK